MREFLELGVGLMNAREADRTLVWFDFAFENLIIVDGKVVAIDVADCNSHSHHFFKHKNHVILEKDPADGQMKTLYDNATRATHRACTHMSLAQYGELLQYQIAAALMETQVVGHPIN